MSNPNQTNPDAYNGWQNFETWVTALWIGNDPGSDEWAHQLVADAYAAAARAIAQDPAAITAPLSTAADALKDWIEDLNPLAGQANVFSDLISHALRGVDWREIAEHYHQDNDNDC